MKYLIILLDDTSSEFCHYSSSSFIQRLIPLDILEKGVTFATGKGLAIQMVYPKTELPQTYTDFITSVNHAVIAPCGSSVQADVTVCNSLDELFMAPEGGSCVFRQKKEDFFQYHEQVQPLLKKFTRFNLVITDVDSFQDKDKDIYLHILTRWADTLIDAIQKEQNTTSINVISDRLALSSMNNCNAGIDSITLAPDGNFYICPAFYTSGQKPVGTIESGINIPNQSLYSLDRAPICRTCDAWHCRRCVWLNKLLTREVNTPSHQQCVISHVEREASRYLQQRLCKLNYITNSPTIKHLHYWDPLDAIIEQKSFYRK